MEEAIARASVVTDVVSSLSVDVDARINFALQQNDVPVVKSIRLRNHTSPPLRELRVEVRAEPEFATAWSRHLDVLPEEAEHTLHEVDLLLRPEFLATLTEKVRGLLHVSLLQGETVLASQALPVELLAYDEWSGLQSLPEILAAFVLPNHPSVESTLFRASELLRINTGDGSLNGYQTRSRDRVVRIIEAIYLALTEQGIVYTAPPASFEQTGQKIRTPDRIFEAKLATCLDLAVLAAACMEQAGLHPIIVIIKGHAFAGAWLDEECFAHSAEDDPLKLRKRVELSEICVFETTLITGTPSPEFARALAEGKRHLEATEDFLCLIDIVRARKSGIRPLPLRNEGGRTVVAPDVPTGTAAPLAPSAIAVLERMNEEATTETPQSRLDTWRRKLLDLTLHNRLLNYKDSKKALPIICHDLATLEDSLADNTSFQLRARPSEFSAVDPRDADAFRRRTGDEGLRRLVSEELKAKRLCGDVTPEELERRLIELYRAARISMEEGGASALYLAVGYLRWYESKHSVKPLLAPLLLIPVELERRSIQHGFRLLRGADDTRVNTTLIERLRADFGLTISGLDPLPQDDSGVDVGAVLRKFREAVKDIDRWEMIDAAALGFFSFAKFLMWRDLQERANELMNSPVVRHLVQRDGTRFDPDFMTRQPEKLDEIHQPKDCFTPLDADSSQLWSVLCAAQGRSFVLWGPPGTGKSQTITNMIAHALATGKTVLFVSEKSAALNVVFSRLKKLGLERFCLELHSNKARKHDVIQQLGEVLDVVAQQPAEDWQRKADQLAQLRNQLNAVVDALHRRRSNGLTAFLATSRLSALRRVPRLPLSWADPNEHTPDTLDGFRDCVEALTALAERIGPLAEHPWRCITQTDWTNQWQGELQAQVARALEAARSAEANREAAARLLGAQQQEWTKARIDLLAELAQYMLMRPALPASILERENWQEILTTVREWTKLGQHRDQLRQKVYGRLDRQVMSRDWSSAQAAWSAAQETSPLASVPDDLDAFSVELSSWMEILQKRSSLRTAVFTVFRQEVMLADVDTLTEKWKSAQSAGALTRWFARWRARSAVKPVLTNSVIADNVVVATLVELQALKASEASVHAFAAAAKARLGNIWKEGEPETERLDSVLQWTKKTAALASELNALATSERIPAPQLADWLATLCELRRIEEQTADASADATVLLGRYWNNGEPDWNKLGQVMQWAQKVRQLVDELNCAVAMDAAAQRKVLAQLVTESRESLRPEGDAGSALMAFRVSWEEALKERTALAATAKVPVDGLPFNAASSTFLTDFTSTAEHWQQSFHRLREWCDWNARRAEATALGMSRLVQAYEKGEINRGELLDVFHRSYYEWWLGRLVDSEDVLRRFCSTEHERMISKFRQIDGEYLKLTREHVAAQLAANVPTAETGKPKDPEMAVLQHELRKKRRHVSVRTLVGKIPTLLPRLKPCLLMSPMSVAQYLDPAFPPFDIVVFDEASQIPVWDAVGALARGKQAVVVGDPKQLPPTNFFSRSDEGDEEVEESLQDLESVLDDCLGAQMPQLHLDWHYRSRHESLIHFSNHHYYENRLLIFPSPIPVGMGVQWRYVSNGVYGRSKDRTNRPEAERVVAEVVGRLVDRKRQPRQTQNGCVNSIGVVTFSVAQQALVEELLDQARRENPEIERFFSEDEVEEPVFVKNLENVQGDERDVIIFSICYGPDHTGFVSLNFGPINKSGGERRLNVAITRARRELLVYTSLRADMINLSRTKAVGSAHLKTFLDYAERGPVALPSATVLREGAECESPLEQEIHDALVARGWELHKQVGCSGYRIDLAVVHPELKGRYAIGVECDGANYHCAKSARDRDRLRDGVLRDLGWKLIRIWSTDWWTDPEREIKKLDDAIRKAIEEVAQQSDDAPAFEEDVITEKPIFEPATQRIAKSFASVSTTEPAFTPAKPSTSLPQYTPMRVTRTLGTQTDFDTPAARQQIPEILREVAAAEGPVAFQVACRRVAAHWGIQRATGRIQDAVREHIVHAGLRLWDSGGVEFLWPSDKEPHQHEGFRVNGPDRDSSRGIDEIPLEEIANAIRHVLPLSQGVPEEEVISTTARLLGFSRTGSTVASRISAALGLLLRRDAENASDGKIQLR